MKIHDKIKARREALGLSVKEVAEDAGLSIHEYQDIEWVEDEIFSVVHLKNVKRLCNALQADLYDLFEFECLLCSPGNKYDVSVISNRNKLIKERRTALGLTTEELSDRIGFYEIAVRDMENDPDFLEGWSLDLIKELAKVLDIPFQILLGVTCKKCNQ